MSGHLGSARFFERCISHGARRKQFDFLTQALRLFGKAFCKGLGLFETASLHGAAPSLLGGSATGVLITDDCHRTLR
jgi:hypothetical protein